MTSQKEIIGNDKYIPVHNAGFVGLIDIMGDDERICDAARVSYGKNKQKRTPEENRHLIRYMLRNGHSSPFEQVELVFHIKLPIFVMRQHIRHRTASVNEYSGRYSEMSNEFYFPEATYLMKQSNNNKQGRDGVIADTDIIQKIMMNVYEASYNGYMYLLEKFDLARELARIIMPVANYTECYWKIDLKNLLHYFSLRRDGHAQKEIRDFADAMFKLVKPYVPYTIEAWEDYMFHSYNLSRQEVEVVKEIIQTNQIPPVDQNKLVEKYGMSKRESQEFLNKFFSQ
jgi:thymidylate synthase (FAD)